MVLGRIAQGCRREGRRKKGAVEGQLRRAEKCRKKGAGEGQLRKRSVSEKDRGNTCYRYVGLNNLRLKYSKGDKTKL